MPFTAPDGGDPLAYTLRIKKASLPTVGDGLQAMSNQIDRIHERTARGVDYQGYPFAPYSTGGRTSFTVRPGPNRTRRQKKFAKRTGGVPHTSSYAISYKGYAAKKRLITGTDTVNLNVRGDMLGAIEGRAQGATVRGGATVPLGAHDSPLVSAAEYGIYDSKQAVKARAHNEGTKRIPERHFFDTSATDLLLIETDIELRVDERLTVLLK